MHPAAEAAAGRYLRHADRLLPGVVTGFYVVGSTALGAFVEGRSDVDFVAVVDDLEPDQVRRLRALHVVSAADSGFGAMRRRRSPLTGTCNGNFFRATDLTLPVSRVRPIAGHVGHVFKVGEGGSDVSPVGWKVWAEKGCVVRGTAPEDIGLDPELPTMTEWNLGNLESYWRPWATRVRRRPRPMFDVRPGFWTAWGMSGAPRLHYSIATGDVASKEAAAEYALDVFDPCWHPLLLDSLAYLRRQPRPHLDLSTADRGRLTAEFVLAVVHDAQRVASVDR